MKINIHLLLQVSLNTSGFTYLWIYY